MTTLAGNLAGDLAGGLGAGLGPEDGGATPRSILGSLLVEYWDSSLGVALAGGNVDTWTGQKLGKVVQAPGVASRPLYGPDAGQFKGLNVISLVGGATALELRATSGLALTAGGTRPSFVLIRRVAVQVTLNDAYPLVLDDGIGNGQLLDINQVSPGAGQVTVAFTGASGQIHTSRDTLLHSVEASSSAVPVGSMFVDGVSVGTPTAPAVELAIDALYLGHAFGGVSAGTINIAALYVLSAQMSVAQRTAFHTYCTTRWGVP